METPKTLQQAIKFFSDPDKALAFAVARRWPDGVTCPTCGRGEPRFIATRRMWECKTKHPRKQFTVKVGTIFEDSPIALEKWLMAFWMLANCRNGVSSYEIARAIGVTQKSAWFMMHRIRLALKTGSFSKKLGGGEGSEIEVDETFVGPQAWNVHFNKRETRVGQKNKAMIVGLLERGTEVRAEVITSRKKKPLQDIVKANVEPGTAVFTDKLLSYKGLDKHFTHESIDHALGYVSGRIHTNGLENFWSLLKRGLGGTYINVEPFHLFRYLDEQVFRYNNRRDEQKQPRTDAERFTLAMNGFSGKRLTYAALTGKGVETNV